MFEKFSKTILIAEMLVIALPLTLILFIGFGVMFDGFNFKSEKLSYEIITALILLSVYFAVPIGWYLAYVFIFKGRKGLRTVKNIVYILPMIAMLTPLLPKFHYLLQKHYFAQHEQYMTNVSTIAPMGIYFLPLFVHLVIEYIVSRQQLYK